MVSESWMERLENRVDAVSVAQREVELVQAAAATTDLALIHAEMASLRSDVNTKIDGLHRDVASLRWAAAGVLSVVLTGFAGLGAGVWLLYGKLVDISAGLAVRAVEIGQPVIEGTVTP